MVNTTDKEYEKFVEANSYVTVRLKGTTVSVTGLTGNKSRNDAENLKFTTTTAGDTAILIKGD